MTSMITETFRRWLSHRRLKVAAEEKSVEQIEQEIKLKEQEAEFLKQEIESVEQEIEFWNAFYRWLEDENETELTARRDALLVLLGNHDRAIDRIRLRRKTAALVETARTGLWQQRPDS